MAAKAKDLVKAALDAGVTNPTEGVAWIKKHHGVEMRTSVFGAVKKFVVADDATAGQVKVEQVVVTTGQEPSLLALVERIKGLVATYGKDKVSVAVDICGLFEPGK